MPEIRDSTGIVRRPPRLLGGDIPIRGIAGDQQAALVGQACLSPGMVKATFGTGAFMLLHTWHASAGPAPATGMLTTVALATAAGSALTRSRVRYFQPARACSGCATALASSNTPPRPAMASPLGSRPGAGQVYLVPAFTGLGAPHWNSHARATLSGMSRGTTQARAGPGRAGIRRLPDPRVARRHAGATPASTARRRGARWCFASTAG